MRPTKGKIVDFWMQESEHPQPAIIVKVVSDDGIVNLRVFEDNANSPRWVTNVHHADTPDSKQTCWWSWPDRRDGS